MPTSDETPAGGNHPDLGTLRAAARGLDEGPMGRFQITGPTTEELRKARGEERAQGIRFAERLFAGLPSSGREPSMRILQARADGKLEISLWTFDHSGDFNPIPTRDFWEGARDHLRALYEHSENVVIDGTYDLTEPQNDTDQMGRRSPDRRHIDIVAKWGPETL